MKPRATQSHLPLPPSQRETSGCTTTCDGWCKLGLTPATALRSATFDAARFGGLSSRVGSIAPSKMADLLILSANPLDEVGNVALIDAIVVDGRFVNGAERNARLARLPSR